jgi:predicted HTH domain antitoxin
MIAQSFTVELPADILLTLNESSEELKQRLKLTLAIQLYLEEKVTIGKAAQIAAHSKLDFEMILSQHQIPISLLSIEEVYQDAQKLK